MAYTAKTNVTAQIPALWETDLIAQAESLTFWHRFEGPEGSGMPIVRKDDLTKTAGDTIKYDMVLALTGAGVTGDTNALAGNEEALKFRQTSVSVADLSHAVSWTELAEALITHDMRSTALNQLSKWLAGKLDTALWAELTGSGTTLPTPNQWFAGAATSIGTVTASYYPTLNDISDLKAYAQANLKVEPLKMEDGQEYFGLVLHPYSNLALKKDTNYQQAQRDANVRGESGNPLFTGATAVWDGVIIYTSNRVPTANDGAASVPVARNVFFGAQAAARGFAMYPDWREELFDYGRRAGVATTLIKGEKLNVFDLSAAGDNSGNQAIGSAVLYAYAGAPVA